MDGGFKTTGLRPWTYLLSPSMVDSGAFWHKTSGTSDDAYAAPTEASLLKSGVPNTPTHPLNYPEELGAQLELKNYLVYFQHSARDAALLVRMLCVLRLDDDDGRPTRRDTVDRKRRPTRTLSVC